MFFHFCLVSIHLSGPFLLKMKLAETLSYWYSLITRNHYPLKSTGTKTSKMKVVRPGSMCGVCKVVSRMRCNDVQIFCAFKVYLSLSRDATKTNLPPLSMYYALNTYMYVYLSVNIPFSVSKGSPVILEHW